jgi:hypothetical protein
MDMVSDPLCGSLEFKLSHTYIDFQMNIQEFERQERITVRENKRCSEFTEQFSMPNVVGPLYVPR